METLVFVLIGIIAGIIIAQYLPADVVVKLGQIKLKNNSIDAPPNQLDIPFNTLKKLQRAEEVKKKRVGLFKRIFKKRGA